MTRLVPAIALAGLAVALAGCGGGSGQTLHIFTKPATPTTVDLGPSGKSDGDEYVFDSDILDESKANVIGHVYGVQTSLDLDPRREVVQAMITYELGDKDSITIGGISSYPLTGAGLVPNQAFERPILGGTGKYAGARGTVTSIQHADGMYEQTFHLDG